MFLYCLQTSKSHSSTSCCFFPKDRKIERQNQNVLVKAQPSLFIWHFMLSYKRRVSLKYFAWTHKLSDSELNGTFRVTCTGEVVAQFLRKLGENHHMSSANGDWTTLSGALQMKVPNWMSDVRGLPKLIFRSWQPSIYPACPVRIISYTAQ